MAISFIRTIILFSSLLLSMRIMGKRQLGELELSELVVAVLISDLAAHPLQDIGTPLLYGLIPVFTLLAFEILISGATIKSIRFRALICGKPSILIDNGKVVQSEMKKNRFTIDELGVELRKKNITDISTVKHAILETDGTLSILLFPGESPVTSSQMNIAVEDSGYPVIVINDGKILSNNLKLMGLDEKWLQKQLNIRNIEEAKQVYLMSVDTMGKIYFSPKEAI